MSQTMSPELNLSGHIRNLYLAAIDSPLLVTGSKGATDAFSSQEAVQGLRGQSNAPVAGLSTESY